MNHVVLLGDSIFDNERYVPGGPAVIEQLRRLLSSGWRASLLARDGDRTFEVFSQLNRLPADASHLVVSAGGNNALENVLVFQEPAESMAQAMARLTDMRDEFLQTYRRMLEAVVEKSKPTAVCTIYDAIPGLPEIERTGLCLFNDVILREAFRLRFPVIDLRLICNEASDYARNSPIEPSVSGGAKIARAIVRLLSAPSFPPFFCPVLPVP